jgi:hypothetical protein
MSPPAFIAYTIASLIIGWFGRSLRFGFWGYFFASLFFTPLVGMILVIGSMPVKDKQPNDKEKNNCS